MRGYLDEPRGMHLLGKCSILMLLFYFHNFFLGYCKCEFSGIAFKFVLSKEYVALTLLRYC
uniref:Uncharacterized protein n=1 Tax=Manihot esculenta TaxID=3983 RepID=A0A2C9TZU9_MANES